MESKIVRLWKIKQLVPIPSRSASLHQHLHQMQTCVPHHCVLVRGTSPIEPTQTMSRSTSHSALLEEDCETQERIWDGFLVGACVG